MLLGRKLPHYVRLRGVLILLSAVLMSVEATHTASASEAVDGYSLSETPDWVQPTPAFDPHLERIVEPIYGFRTRLHEFQYNGTEPGNASFYYAVEYDLVNQYGVENYSNIELSFDPSYEKLELHELVVKRGDKFINKIQTARFDVLRTENDRAELIYNGTRTLAIVLDDVRTGDVVRYAYSITGENPIFQGNREFQVHTDLWSGVDRQYTRILTANDKPLNRRVRGSDVPLEINQLDGIEEIIIDQRGVEDFEVEDDVPSWHYNRGTIVFSDMPDWRAVVDWALPMYELPDAPIPEIVTVAGVIKTAHDDDDARIGAALRWVQEEIRYFGVELGKNSHWPSRPEETLERRFGDCKDKALLLIALLKQLGFDAQPALVSTERGLESAYYPYRMHAFDHVIVHLLKDGEAHFIDPTRRNQMGDLGQVHEPDYGRALILSDNSIGLSVMGNSRSQRSRSVTKQLTVPQADEAIEMTVSTAKQGILAENLRHSLETDGVKGLAESYLEYYQGYFDDLSEKEPIQFSRDSSDAISVSEQYSIDNFWLADENVQRYRWLFADEVIGALDLPENPKNRQLPYELVHPVVIEESWVVDMPIDLRLDDLDAQFSNEWLSFSKESLLNEDETQLTVKFRFATLRNEVAAEDLVEYAKSVEKINDLASFYLEDEPEQSATVMLANRVVKAGSLNIWICLLGFLLLCNRRSAYPA